MDVTYTVHYALQERATGRVFEASASDGFDAVVELLLLPALPFAMHGANVTYDRLADSLFNQLSAQGAFQLSAEESARTAPSTETPLDHTQSPAEPAIPGVEERLQELDEL